MNTATLVSVEIRKMTDTRSGRATLGLIVGLTAFALLWKVTHPAIEVAFDNYGWSVTTIVAFGAPIVGLLAMTSEWTQRTALSTFTLVPRRGRVISAKFLAATVISLALLAIELALAAGVTAIGGAVHGHASYADALVTIRGSIIFVMLQVIMASAFGALIAHTGVALVLYLTAPAIWADVSGELFKGLAPWLDVFDAYARLSSNEPFERFDQTLTSITVWVLIPAAIGVARSLRREVK